MIGRAKLADAIHAALLTESTAAAVPLVIHLAYRNRWLQAAQIAGTPASGVPPLVMTNEIFCSEAWARFDPAQVARHGAGSYALARELADARLRATVCRYLPHGVVPAHDGAAVRTTTPVLWLTGDGDPQDPAANLREVPAQQPHSRVVVMPAQQHVVGPLGCMPQVIGAFLDSGSASHLDTSCAASGAPSPPFRLR